ncbi:DUF3182 family protein [Pseudomonas mangrovi]|uniref:DUF3182 domain-containing protein n=1 Tax=Pseudomonas mangrovi TaxID=2161748 RepID=A0A2T5PC64_9PSED|nr:DUF3182 family protein [Pseudomonas mangrovi]PTU75315.1 DUF3182 domain-containing protein [Pseudomonas mangrovi]
MSESIQTKPFLAFLPNRDDMPTHEAVAQRVLAEQLAQLLRMGYIGDYPRDADGELAYEAVGPCYLVPSDTIIGTEQAARLGIRGEDDLFGAVAPYAFLPTKAISHPLGHAGAEAPPGWSTVFGERIGDAVLEGFSAFSIVDARGAGLALLADGPLRIKPVLARGGLGQQVVRSADELELALETLDAGALALCGLVLERQLEQVRTFSVGQVRVAGLLVSYVGEQHLTCDNQGREVYGGSTLQLCRGGFAALQQLPLSEEMRQAIHQAQTYDEAALACFPGLIASRRNYDVALGTDPQGRSRSGVLEQSWRIGGASSAEVIALQRFQAEPALQRLRASSVEVYGQPPSLPADALLIYQGTDPQSGPLTKYARIEDAGE